jgi:hypothetical protein
MPPPVLENFVFLLVVLCRVRSPIDFCSPSPASFPLPVHRSDPVSFSYREPSVPAAPVLCFRLGLSCLSRFSAGFGFAAKGLTSPSVFSIPRCPVSVFSTDFVLSRRRCLLRLILPPPVGRESCPPTIHRQGSARSGFSFAAELASIPDQDIRFRLRFFGAANPESVLP